jgi:pimeloyl-ACP methyl ester carboxylesterase
MLRLLAILPLLLLSLTALAQNPLEVQPQAAELWYGKLDADVREFRFLIEVNQQGTGRTAVLTSFDEGSTRFKLDRFQVAERMFEFELKSTKAIYSGQLNEAGDVVTGNWQQGPANLPLRFERVEAVPIEQPDEVWVGTLNAGFQKLKMQFRIFRTDEPEHLLLFDSLNQSAGGFRGKAKLTGSEVEFSVPALGATFTGSKSADGKLLEGKFKQGPGEFPLQLEWRDEPELATAIILRRPQTPQPPYAYRSEEVRFPNSAAGIELAGTLTLPEGAGPFPAAILVSGSGPQDRDETILEHKPFHVLADHLTQAGIAVLRYDDRGVAESGGKFSTATSEDFTGDALAAFAYLQGRAEIAPGRVGIIGHSEGGLIAPWAAVRNPNVAWIVLLAGPGVNGEQILYSQGQLLLKAEGADEAALTRQRLVQETLIGLLREQDGNSDRETLGQRGVELLSQKLRAIAPPAGQPEGTDPNPLAEPDSETSQALIKSLVLANLGVMDTPWFRLFVRHEPGPILQQVKCPVLAVNGSKDLQVDPQLNLPAIEKALRAGGNTDVTIRELQGLNHLFQSCQTGAASEYEQIEETLAPQLLETVVSWIQSKAGGRK